MRITINLPEELLARAKKAAKDSRVSLSKFIIDALRLALDRTKASPTDISPMPTFTPPPGKEGFQPGVDLNNNAALLDLMEGYDTTDKG